MDWIKIIRGIPRTVFTSTTVNPCASTRATLRWLIYNFGKMGVIILRHWQQCFHRHNNVLGHCVQCDWTSARYKIQSSGDNSVNWSIFFFTRAIFILLEQSLFYSGNDQYWFHDFRNSDVEHYSSRWQPSPEKETALGLNLNLRWYNGDNDNI